MNEPIFTPDLDGQMRMIAALRAQLAGRTGGPERTELVETHISWVLLAGDEAFKIKKAVGLDFLDFSTLEDRRFFCQEELRLNRRTAPELYLDVLPITGPPEQPAIDGHGPVIDYAVHMRRFAPEQLLTAHLAGEPAPWLGGALASAVAGFHRTLPRSRGSSLHGLPEEIRNATGEVCASLNALVPSATGHHLLREVAAWIEAEGERLDCVFSARRQAGRVRECHGDLHCGNIIAHDGVARLFDGIEFSASLRFIDVIDDLAFLLMDLQARGQPRLANECLNRYLEITADYEGLRVLRYYVAYRALVRAMVSLLQRAESATAVAAAEARAVAYLAVAQAQSRTTPPALVLTHGFSGAGKSSLSLALAAHLGGIRLRADVERGRLYGTGAASRPDKYAPYASEATYERLAHLATLCVASGWMPVVDATFLQRVRRARFHALAAELQARLGVVDFQAPPALLAERIRDRHGSDASEADLRVLQHQLATAEPLTPDEPGHVLPYDTTRALADAHQPDSWQPLLDYLMRPPPPAD
ncbi:MAG: AAA family ATPase [Rhodocyclaceae bacterium]|nr:AAA family ATPase [Rhodocyclaceae bacterium]